MRNLDNTQFTDERGLHVWDGDPTINAASTDQEQLMTLLMCDMVGSTELLTKLTGPEFQEVLLEYYALCCQAIESQLGNVIRYVGDAVLARFEHESSHDRGALTAVAAALDIQQQLTGCALASRLDLSVRISIATGLGVRAHIPTTSNVPQEVVFGELPFLAARLQARACPNSVVLCEGTAALVQRNYAIHFLGPQRLKGFSDARKVWQVGNGYSDDALENQRENVKPANARGARA